MYSRMRGGLRGVCVSAPYDRVAGQLVFVQLWLRDLAWLKHHLIACKCLPAITKRGTCEKQGALVKKNSQWLNWCGEISFLKMLCTFFLIAPWKCKKWDYVTLFAFIVQVLFLILKYMLKCHVKQSNWKHFWCWSIGIFLNSSQSDHKFSKKFPVMTLGWLQRLNFTREKVLQP